MINTARLVDEKDFEYCLRLCDYKIHRQINLDWNEIAKLLNNKFGGGDALRHKAYAWEEYSKFTSQDDCVFNRILSISDLHIPFNLPLETFSKWRELVDVLVLNGDIQDCQSCSRFSKKYRVDFVDEMVLTRQYCIDLINMIKPKRVIFVKGNHEVRLGRYLSDKLNDDLMKLMPDTPLDLIVNDGFKNRDRYKGTETWYEPLVKVFKDRGINIDYDGSWYRKVGKTLFVHPLSYSSGMLKTTEKAVEYFLRIDRDFDTICMSHTHKLGSYIQGDINMYEQGCCANTDLLNYNDGYMTIPSQKGFIYLLQDKDGRNIENKTKLIKLI